MVAAQGEWTDKGTGKVTVLKAKTAGVRARARAAAPVRGCSPPRPAAQADGKRPAKLVIRSDTGRITFNACLYSGLKVELKASKPGGPQSNLVTSLLNSVAAESSLLLPCARPPPAAGPVRATCDV